MGVQWCSEGAARMRKRLPRLSQDDVRELGRAHENLTAAIMALNGLKGMAVVPAIVAVQQVDRFVCALYNRAEPVYLASPGCRRAVQGKSAPADLSAGIATAGNLGTDRGGVPELPPGSADLVQG
jgi:hypothetical protein